jgi:hypothetical protein
MTRMPSHGTPCGREPDGQFPGTVDGGGPSLVAEDRIGRLVAGDRAAMTLGWRDDPLAGLPPLTRAAIERALIQGADEPGALSEIVADAAEAEHHGDRVEAAALRELADLFAEDPPEGPTLLTILRRVRTAIERAQGAGSEGLP